MEGLLIAEQLRRVAPLLPSPRLSWRFPDAYTFVLPLKKGALWLYNRPPHAQLAYKDEVPPVGRAHSGFQDLLVARAAGDLLSAEQVKLDRALRLELAPSRGFVETPGVTLVAELTGRNCNLILLGEDSVILGAAREISSAINRFREVRAGLRYEPPPPYEKLDPRTLSETELTELLTGRKLSEVRSILDGIGPELTAAVAQLVGVPRNGVLSEADAGKAAATVRRLSEAPSEVLNEVGGRADLGALREAEAQEARVQRLRSTLEKRRSLAQKRLDDIMRTLEAALEAERLRADADLLMAYPKAVPPHAAHVTLTDFSGEPREIALDARLSAVENAQALYERAKKREGRLEQAASREEGLKTELTELTELLGRLPELLDAELKALSQSYVAETKPQSRAAPGTRYTSPQGFEVWVGRTAKGNDELTFKLAKSRDLWLHAQGYPGSHVIVRADNREVPFETVLFAAQLAAAYSKANLSDNVPVDYTLKKNVWKVKGGAPGAVNFSQQKTVYVTPSRRPEEA
jgi:predicted ribosome quality control (RQC) complex YloA/Tae2 family protein